MVGSALHPKGKPWNYLTRIAADRQSATAKDLENYYPKLVAVAPDGTIWVMGSVRLEKGMWQHNLLRHYDSAGKPIAGGRGMSGDENDRTPGSTLRCSRDRVAWLSNSNEYTEVSFQGELQTYAPGPPREGPGWQAGMALSVNNEVIVTTTRPGSWDVWRLDRSKLRWLPVEMRSTEIIDSPMTVGFDDDSLVAFLFWPGRRVGWFDRKK